MSVIGNAIMLGGLVGGNPTAEENDVIFIDYDGTIRYSYSAAEFANLTALPKNPTHDGLTAQGWNWTLADAKVYVAEYGLLIIGQMYKPSDNKFHIHASFTYGRLSPILGIAVNGTAVIDWGDGSPNDTVVGSSLTTAIDTQHTYQDAGDRDISITIDGEIAILGSTAGTKLLYSGPSATADQNFVYQSAIKHIYMCDHSNISDYAFYSLYSLQSIVMQNNMQTFNPQCFRSCYSLHGVVLPIDTAYVGNYAFESCATLHRISFPKNLVAIHVSAFSNNRILHKISIPSSVTTLSNNAFSSDYALSSVIFPASLTTISVFAFGGCCGIGAMRFSRSTPTSIANSNVFSSLPTDCIIYIPYGSLASYLSATNYPTPATYTYLGFATYASGATLPTQDSTESYNVTWYASKQDAVDQTNAITVGNGNEIYCRYAAV